MTLSAVASSVPYRMSISAWPAVPTSWWCTSILMPDLLEVQHHLRAQVLVVVHRGQREVPLLVPGLVAEVRLARELALAARVPHALDRVDVVVALVLVLVEPDRVEDVELALRSPERRVGDPGLLQVQLGLPRDVARVARVHLAGDRVLDEAVHVQRRVLRERVEERGVGVGDQEHVGLLDLLEPADRRAVEAEPVLEALLGELETGIEKCCISPGRSENRRSTICGARLLGQGQDLLRCGHAFALPFVRWDGFRVGARRGGRFPAR